MSFVATAALPYHLRPRRQKIFGREKPQRLDGNAKARIKTYIRALMRKTEPGKHYGLITAKHCDVLDALLWGFHGPQGLCFPSYEAIAKKAGCARSTVAEAIKALEEAGILTWVNCITRVRERTVDLFDKWATRWRVIRTSNAYSFRDPGQLGERPRSKAFSSKSEIQSGIPIPDSYSSVPVTPSPPLDPKSPLALALHGLGKAIGAA